MKYTNNIERYSIFELSMDGPFEGNPFIEQKISGRFISESEDVSADGFYDGDGVYKVRFMPSFTGEYTFSVHAGFLDEEIKGSFTVSDAKEGNHGPVRVHNKYHFAYADGTPYYSIGTTCYVWNLQSDERIEETLKTLENSAFNKIRFCVFPKHYDYNLTEPRSYPYIGTPMDSGVLTKENFWAYNENSEGNEWDFYRFNPEHFRHIENCILQLQKLGIEADIIVMHPYDRWGFSNMPADADDLYWRYIIARFSAFRNVWWSLANEYDIMRNKTEDDFERYAEIICQSDPYSHLCSIHNCMRMYDFSRDWITHCSIQRCDLYKCAELVSEYRKQYGKPVVLDEIAYEGNIQHGWGNITGEEMLRRFWECAVRGGYPGHGETYMNPDDVLWWSHGGVLHGESHKRFKLLYEILKETPGNGLKEYAMAWDMIAGVPEKEDTEKYYLLYFSFMRPSFRDFYFDDHTPYRVKVIDTWDMTVTDIGVFKGHFRVDLPGKQYMAIQIREEKE